MSDDNRENRIAERAYARWEAEGRPTGRHDAHWQDAAREIDGDSPPVADQPKPKRAAKKGATDKPAPAPRKPRKSAAKPPA